MSSHHRLSCWTPETTQRLTKGGPSAFQVLDHVAPNPHSIQSELHANNWFDCLRPARTQADVLRDERLSSEVWTMTRGDKSCFLPRNYRDTDTFQVKHPALQDLISRVEATVQEELHETIQFHHTSVQLAMYPGDGTSGYPRHCDRSNKCRDETNQHNDFNTSSPLVERLISCIYYLTHPDWCEEDGGHLRLFTTSEQPFDIIPFINRMVVFRSDAVEHQVLPSNRDRIALTIWVYGTLLNNSTPISEQPFTTVDPNKQLSPPSLSVPDMHDSTSTIFVAIASYRDSETGPTIQACLQSAQYPNRITIGVLLQVDLAQDGDIVASIPTTANIRVMQLHAKDAAGPCYARALCQHLMQDETYYLQIDSHMRFRYNWDTYLIHTLPTSNRAMLTAYPVGYQLPNAIPNETRGTLLVPWKMDGNLLRQRGRLMKHSTTPTRCYLYAAGFNFSRAHSVQEVPYDGTLRHLFFGEELSMAARLYCAGWDLYAPPESVVYHLWSRSHRPSGYVDEMARTQAIHRVVDQVVNGTTDSGLRSIKGFWQGLQVDIQNHTFQEGAENGVLKNCDFTQGGLEVTEPKDLHSRGMWHYSISRLKILSHPFSFSYNHEYSRHICLAPT